MLLSSFVAGFLWHWLFNTDIPSYLSGAVGGLTAAPTWELLKQLMLGVGIAEQNTGLIFDSSTIVLCNVFGLYVGSSMMVTGLHWISKDRGASC